MRNWFLGEGCDLEASLAELEVLNPVVSMAELRAWRTDFGKVFHPRELTLEESLVLSQVTAVVVHRLESMPRITTLVDARSSARRRRSRRRSTAG